MCSERMWNVNERLETFLLDIRIRMDFTCRSSGTWFPSKWQNRHGTELNSQSLLFSLSFRFTFARFKYSMSTAWAGSGRRDEWKQIHSTYISMAIIGDSRTNDLIANHGYYILILSRANCKLPVSTKNGYLTRLVAFVSIVFFSAFRGNEFSGVVVGVNQFRTFSD